MRMMKTCHFCNSENVELSVLTIGDFDFVSVKCLDCKCQGPPAESQAQAVINWNQTHLRTWANPHNKDGE